MLFLLILHFDYIYYFCQFLGSTIGGDAKDGRTSGYIYSGGTVIGTFSLSDNCRSGASDAIRELKSMGIKTALLTGDSQSAAMHAQEQVWFST